ncbi:hypothetical protein Hypma_007764 [Hypsizygus marmoreus]|uniref:Calcineurin-like phosphoesterase domain-containing protein n=1 Tax=Hypsizygus marmoreus TaxID=39966 RepID=A0A369JSI5_HYPMA|nr:hypothetical protein Hypma_007764 [Hypsizygus marmoreus]
MNTMRLGERRKFRTSSHLYSRTVTINFFRLSWIVLIIWGELGAFFWSLSSCKWPEFSTARAEKPTRILLISDPQVRHPAAAGSQSLLGHLRHFIFELNLKKSWHVTTRLRPHVVVFLGDMLASGKSVQDETEYQHYVQKFQSIFRLNSAVKSYYIPGNNDVGMGVSPAYSKIIRGHHAKAFGPFNQQIVIRNHTFVLLDAPGLVDEDYQRSAYGVGFDKWNAIPNGTVSFVQDIEPNHSPLILFTHIPLARPDAASCGPFREKGTIRRGVGHGYQNTFGKQTTAFLLKSLEPAVIFSGDNRDYCEYIHVSKDKTGAADVREVTVKSFSMANNIRHPGFQLLSLIEPSSVAGSAQSSFLDRPCFLPDQYGIYTAIYLPFLIFTGLTIFVFALVRRNARVPHIEPLTISPQSSSGRSSPLPPPPESAIWSPYTPAVSVSPKAALPSYMRTPNAPAGPTFRVSRPATPLGSPLLPPMFYTQEEDDEAMYPSQYSSRRDSRTHEDDEEWSPGHNGLNSDPQIPHFTSAPGLKPVVNRRWSWSWTFVFRGRRRRMTLRAPAFSWATLAALAELFRTDRHAVTRQHILRTALRDGLSILWPIVIVWAFLTWRML